MKGKQRTGLWISRLVIWIAIFCTLFPAYWIFMASFSAGQSFFSATLFPKALTAHNYERLISETDFMRWVGNSLKICLWVSVIQLFLTSTSAYAFSRLRFPGRKNGLMALLVLQVFPSSMAVSGFYILIYRFGLSDSVYALILVLAGGSAFNIWLLKAYIDTIPKELDEAAFVSGAGHGVVFTRIILPLARPQLAVIFVFSFIATYSEYVISSVFLNKPENHTLALGLQTFITNQFAANWTLFAAAAVLSSLPIMVMFMFMQRFIQNGLAATGVKG
ncbi:sugar ABC transporter permease [Cohnella fermenti]|uniref:Sugar ABC transporter permease n=1 Tax=Cohnella fermenti TaxID=2565925 RepID=A0A4S4BWQ3_9BACL|nr:sugar ABC transporter permease [Cohnella fermenti]THF79043.1 sugar ABC transporter permease [Cohnella fermenti]